MTKKQTLRKIGEVIRGKAVKIITREAFDKGELASSLNVDVKGNTVTVGMNAPHGVYVEYGTGLRGSLGFKRYFGENKPSYTIPIVPKNKKALHWKSGGKDVFAKSSKGMNPVAPIRRALFDSKSDITRVIKEDIERDPSGWLNGND